MTAEWAEELARVSTAAAHAETLIGCIEGWIVQDVVGDDVLPRTLPVAIRSKLSSLRAAVIEVRRMAEKAIDRYSSNPTARFLGGQSLTREEYYLLRAMGVEFGSASGLGLAALNDFDIFRMLCLETHDAMFYINVAERSVAERQDPGRRALRFGKPPEEISENNLRAEQRAFFRQHLPEVYARFRRDPPTTGS